MTERIYLIVADDTEEFGNALRYACKAAKANRTHIGVLYIISEGDFVNWGNIEERIKQDRRRDAEKLLANIAEKIKSICGLMPSLYIGEGAAPEAVIKTIEENPGISNLFLGGSTKGGGPGPLVSYFCGKGLSKLTVPLTVIPDHITLEEKTGES
ncbi:MAG: universal stress protein [Alphaproteobacteria bacterium]